MGGLLSMCFFYGSVSGNHVCLMYCLSTVCGLSCLATVHMHRAMLSCRSG